LATTMQEPAARSVVRTTVTKETLPAGFNGDGKPRAFYDKEDFKEVAFALTAEEWKLHKMRVYRSGEKWEKGAAPVDNIFQGPFTEDDIRARFGGGRYLLWLYGPPKEQQLVGRWQVELEGVPLVRSVPAQPTDGSGSALAVALQQAMNPEVMRVQMDILKTAMVEALQLVKSNIPPAQNPLETLRTAKEILGPPPGNSLVEAIHLLKELGIVGSPEKKGIDEMLEVITSLKTAGLIPGGAPKADLGTTIASNLPMLADRFVQGLRELRLQTEAASRVQQTATMRPNDPNVITVEAAGQRPADAAPPAPAADDGQVHQVNPATASAIIAHYNLQRLVEGIKQPDSTAQDMYDFLLNAWPEVLPELMKHDAPTLLAMFQSREMQMRLFGNEVLFQVAEDPRLPQLLEDFLKIAKAEAEKENAVPVA
jgi:hypothetical protein